MPTMTLTMPIYDIFLCKEIVSMLRPEARNFPIKQRTPRRSPSPSPKEGQAEYWLLTDVLLFVGGAQLQISQLGALPRRF